MFTKTSKNLIPAVTGALSLTGATFAAAQADETDAAADSLIEMEEALISTSLGPSFLAEACLSDGVLLEANVQPYTLAFVPNDFFNNNDDLTLIEQFPYIINRAIADDIQGQFTPQFEGQVSEEVTPDSVKNYLDSIMPDALRNYAHRLKAEFSQSVIREQDYYLHYVSFLPAAEECGEAVAQNDISQSTPRRQFS